MKTHPVLGVQVFWNLRRGRLHAHFHEHGKGGHLHIHASHASGSEPAGDDAHALFNPGRPTFRKKSYLIGIVHGLAGSAAVMLVLLPQIESAWVGVGYLALFGIGTMISMAMITVVIGMPFALTSRFKVMDGAVASVAGGASLLLGAALMLDLAIGTALVPL